MEEVLSTFGDEPYLTTFKLPEHDQRAFDGDTRLVYVKIVGKGDQEIHSIDGANANALCRRCIPKIVRKMTLGCNFNDSQQIIVIGRSKF